MLLFSKKSLLWCGGAFFIALQAYVSRLGEQRTSRFFSVSCVLVGQKNEKYK
jgi:hypothetical protein